MREDKDEKFINLKNDNMSMKEYLLKFTQLSRYALEMVIRLRARMRKFFSSVSKLVAKKYRTTMIIGEINLSKPMKPDLNIEKDKIKEKERENKREGTSNFGCTQ